MKKKTISVMMVLVMVLFLFPATFSMEADAASVASKSEIPTTGWTWPVIGNATIYSPYNIGNASLIAKRGEEHNGIDITKNADLTVVAARAGKVVKLCNSGAKGGTACYVTLEHKTSAGKVFYSYYWHLKSGSVIVSVGQEVVAGEKLGITGTTGNSTGVHLHFQVGTSESPNTSTSVNVNPATNALVTSNNTSRYSNAEICWGGTFSYTYVSSPVSPCTNHTYSNYVCTKCGAWDESSLKSKTTVDQYFASTNTGYVRSGPYNDCKVLETLAEGTVIHAVQKVTTAKGTIWYKLDDGRWIYEGNVKTAAPVSFANIAGYTPKQEQIIGTTNATIVTTIKFLNNAAMKGCTKVGIYLYDSSGSTSSSHQLATGSDAMTWTSTPGGVWYDINKELNYTLKPNTKYYYRFYAVISGTTYYSDLRSFTTGGTSGGHTHTYSSAWSSNATNHWHACTGCTATSGLAAHTFSGWATSLEPTHTADGCKYRYCTVCGYTEYATIPATGHTYNQKSTSSTYLKSAATCTQPAVYYYSCSCGAKGTNTFTYGSALGHTYNQMNTSSSYLKTAATCTQPAVYYYSCSCGAKGTNTFTYGSTAPHNYQNGYCTHCHAKDPNSGGNDGDGVNGGFLAKIIEMIRSIFSRFTNIFSIFNKIPKVNI